MLPQLPNVSLLHIEIGLLLYVNVRQMLRQSLGRFTLKVAMMPFVKFSQLGQSSGSQDRKDVQLDLSHLKEVT